MVFDSTFNIISAISWRPVLLVEETGLPGENPLTHRKSLTNFTVSSTPRHERDSNSQL